MANNNISYSGEQTEAVTNNVPGKQTDDLSQAIDVSFQPAITSTSNDGLATEVNDNVVGEHIVDGSFLTDEMATSGRDKLQHNGTSVLGTEATSLDSASPLDVVRF